MALHGGGVEPSLSQFGPSMSQSGPYDPARRAISLVLPSLPSPDYDPGLMRASQASAGVFTRLAFVLLPVLACGGGTEPPGDGGAVGLWSATVTTHGQLPGGPPFTCTVGWAMDIQDISTGGAPELYTLVPFTPRITCTNGYDSPWEYRTYSFLIREDGANLVFLTPSRLDTFLVATTSGSTMSGRIGTAFYQDATFLAARRSGADPNLQPGIFDVATGFPDIEIGETLRVVSAVADGYGQSIDSLTTTWTSSAPAFASVDAGGLVHGVSPGSVWIVGQVASLRDSVTVTVLPPAASVEITQSPDSLIVPGVYQLSAVAKDGSGQPLYDRRLTWESSNPAVATADPGGAIAAITPGTVTITARSTVVSASTTLAVLPAVAQITLSSAGTLVPLGGTLQITATTLDDQGHVLTGRPVTWEAGDGTIISVNGAGLTSGVTAGSIILTVTAEGAVSTLALAAQMDGPLAAVAGGNAHTCGVVTTGRLYCWGQQTVGQLGPATIGGLGAVLVPSAEEFASLAAGGSHTCALNLAGKAFCWGYNSFGQLGAASGATGAVQAVSGGITFSQLTAGFEFTCGLSSGSAFCWGLNGLGQLGRGTDDLVTHTAPVAVVGGHAFTSIAAGETTACGLTAGGQAWCWGSNASGNLGLGTMDGDPHSTPVHAAPALTFTAIAPGRSRTCGITTAGGVTCWGDAQLAPAALDATTGYVEIAAGGGNFCRLKGSGAVSCWGDDNLGTLPADPLAGVRLGSHHACAKVVSSGKVVCWGQDNEGQLGDAGTLFPGPLEPLGQP